MPVQTDIIVIRMAEQAQQHTIVLAEHIKILRQEELSLIVVMDQSHIPVQVAQVLAMEEDEQYFLAFTIAKWVPMATQIIGIAVIKMQRHLAHPTDLVVARLAATLGTPHQTMVVQ